MNFNLPQEIAAVTADDFCPRCRADLEPTGGPCAVCFLNQPEPDESWRAEEADRRRAEFYARMGW